MSIPGFLLVSSSPPSSFFLPSVLPLLPDASGAFFLLSTDTDMRDNRPAMSSPDLEPTLLSTFRPPPRLLPPPCFRGPDPRSLKITGGRLCSPSSSPNPFPCLAPSTPPSFLHVPPHMSNIPMPAISRHLRSLNRLLSAVPPIHQKIQQPNVAVDEAVLLLGPSIHLPPPSSPLTSSRTGSRARGSEHMTHPEARITWSREIPPIVHEMFPSS